MTNPLEVTIGDHRILVDRDSSVGRKLQHEMDLLEDIQVRGYIVEGFSLISTAVGVAFAETLGPNVQLSLANQSMVFRFNGKEVESAFVAESQKVKLADGRMNRKPKPKSEVKPEEALSALDDEIAAKQKADRIATRRAARAAERARKA